jgi:hypothetical protein
VKELRSRRPGGGPSTARAEGAAAVQRQRGTASGQEELGEAAGDLPREERPVWAHTGVARGAAGNAAGVAAVLRAGVAQVGEEQDGAEPCSGNQRGAAAQVRTTHYPARRRG